MTSCASCGHQLGVGRFCTNCGAPVDSSTPVSATVSTPVAVPAPDDDWRTDTAERRLSQAAGDPRTPPAAVAPPPPPRYPLFADEVQEYAPYGPLITTSPESTPEPEVAAADEPAELEYEPEYESYDYDYDYDDERRSPVLWILAAALVLVLVTAGWWFLVRDHGSDPATDDSGSGQSADAQTGDTDGVDVAGRASAKAPETAPPNEDVNGDQVSYDASNMLDGVPETAWRAPGDATGMSLTFTLRDPTELHQVGMINGYAKTSTDSKGRSFDWYLGNRRIDAAIWVFDDGTKVRQHFKEDRALQMIDVDDVVTSKVVLKLVGVSGPGEGNAARNFTAISEVSLVGDPT
jgi:hypothetical protein